MESMLNDNEINPEQLLKMKNSPFVKNGAYTIEDLIEIHYLKLDHAEKMKKYWRWSCNICNSKLATLENHQAHLTTDEHNKNMRLKMKELCIMDLQELRKKYESTNIVQILKEEENVGLVM